MPKLPILLLDPSIERACNTQFLLQLAKYRVPMVQNDDEAFNWIVTRLDSSELPGLLLINYFQTDMPMLRLIPQMRRQGVQMPILFINREELSDCLTTVIDLDGVSCCRPENMLSQIRLLTA